MNTRSLTPHSIFILLIACAVFALLLSACQPASASTSLPPVPSTATMLPTQPPTDKPVDLAAQTPVQATQPPTSTPGDISLDLSGVAQGKTVETVAAVPASTEGPWWGGSPQYTQLTLEGYPISNHRMKPQIFVYPVKDLGENEIAGKVAESLQTLLQTQQAGDELPFLPLFNAKQVIHPQVKYLDFKSGKGVRFLTWYSQGILPINNYELIYTFQGLTGDGDYYIAAVLPVNLPGLPADGNWNGQEPPTGGDYLKYVETVVSTLNEQPPSAYTPDLSKLDTMIQSIEVK